MASAPLKTLDTTSYHVAWICAVADLELTPALLMLDELHRRPDIDNQYDDNTYAFGAIAGHNVVLATCPDAMTGQVNVGHIVGPLFKTFTAIRMTLLVGIGGGVPQKHLFSQPLKDVRLGDVVVGWPSHADGKPAVIYYDSGRSLVNGFQTTTQLNRPHMVLLKALPFLRTDHTLGQSNFHVHLDRLQQHEEHGDEFKHPGLEHDLLFKSTYEHVGEYNSHCSDCDKANLVDRKPRAANQQDKFVFHQGRVATGNSVIQNGRQRDSINDQHGNVFCIDMEAAGVDVNSNCLVIRGISDYADSHKSDKWRSYAAGKAVVFARELLDKIPPADVKEKMASGNKHWLVHRSTNPDFTGRREVIDKIIARITPEDAGNEQRRFVLTGMGGQGKSEICLHVANQVRHRFWGIFWVDASAHNTAEDGFSDIAEALGCEKTIDAVRKTLSNLPPTRQWLLILDNADNPSRDYQIYLPSGNRGAILMTSRNAQCGLLATSGAHDQLESLKEVECIQLLHKTARLSEAAHDTEDHALAVTLLQHLGHHTLAILQAGSYILSTHCSISEYLNFFRTNRQRLLEKSRGQGQSHYDTVYATFGASMEFLESQETGSSEETRRDALQLLKVLSTFHYTTVPLDVLTDVCEGVKEALNTPEKLKMASYSLTAWHVARLPHLISPETNEVKLRLTSAVARLESLALVRTDRPEGACKSVSMHPLVHSWAGDLQTQQERKDALRMTECIVALSNYAFTGWRPYLPQLAPHLKRVVELDVELVDDAAKCRDVLQVCVHIAWTYHRMHLHKDLYEFAGRIAQRLNLYGQEPTWDLRGIYRVLAGAVAHEGSRPAQAIRLFEAIVRLDEKRRSENDLDLLDNLRDLGGAYIANDQTKEGVALLHDVVKRSQRVRPGAQDRHLLEAQQALGQALAMDGQTKEAILLLEQVIVIEQGLFAEDDPRRLEPQQTLAAAYLNDGQIAEATPRLEELARVTAQILGEEHPTTASMQTCLADAYYQAGSLSESIALYEQVVKTGTLVLGRRHPNVLSLEQALARAYLDDGRIQEATGIFERVVHMRNSESDTTDRKRQESYHHLALAYLEAGKASKAVDLLERVLDIAKSIPEEKHPELLLMAQYALSSAYLMVGRVKEAIRILEKVVKGMSLSYDQGPPWRVDLETLLSMAYAMRDGPDSSHKSVSESISATLDPDFQPVKASEQASTDDVPTVDAEGQRLETSRDSLERPFSNSLVLRGLAILVFLTSYLLVYLLST